MRRHAFTLIELMVVVGIIAILIAVLLPVISHMRKEQVAARMASQPHAISTVFADVAAGAASNIAPSQPHARITSFASVIDLTPRLSVGTSEPESIYEAKFTANLTAARPMDAAGDCEIELPLPPEIISLTDLTATVNGTASDGVALRDHKVVWHGMLAAEPTPIALTYSAVGKGLYELSAPPGGILDHFQITLTSHGSDVRMLELSLQPTNLTRADGSTTYTWDYKRLMFAQPIRLDVLGIAPIDRLGELSWLGPLSVVVFGFLVGLVVHALHISSFDRWMLLLTLGTFAGAYPLMYFAQEFVSLRVAVTSSIALVTAVIAVRTITIMGVRRALAGVVLPALAIMSLTLFSAVQPSLQGILLTVGALGFFIAAMILIPKLNGARLGQMARPAIA